MPLLFNPNAEIDKAECPSCGKVRTIGSIHAAGSNMAPCHGLILDQKLVINRPYKSNVFMFPNQRGKDNAT